MTNTKVSILCKDRIVCILQSFSSCYFHQNKFKMYIAMLVSEKKENSASENKHERCRLYKRSTLMTLSIQNRSKLLMSYCDFLTFIYFQVTNNIIEEKKNIYEV